jgi:hypothetical protein
VIRAFRRRAETVAQVPPNNAAQSSATNHAGAELWERCDQRAAPDASACQRPIARGVFALASLLLSLNASAAAPPTLDSLFPAGARRGTTVPLTASGKFETWPVKVWTDFPGLKIEAADKSPKLTAHVAPDTPPGPHLVRVYTADGASALHCFIVGDQDERPEAEPNDQPANAQPIKKLPLTINGRLEKSGDVDCYTVELAAGQTLVAALQGRRIGSPIDPMLHLLDASGTQVAFAHDGLGLDPLLVYRAPEAGKFTLNVSAFAFPPAADVRFTGNKDAVYRLNLTTGPYVRAASPSGITRGKRVSLRPLGWNLDSNPILADATNLPSNADHLLLPVPGGDGPLRVEVTDAADIEEPSSSSSRPPLTPPVNVTGVIAAPGEEDHFQFAAKKGQRLEFLLHAATQGSPLDALLRIRDDAGKLMDENNGGAGADPRINWNPPRDGLYNLTLHDIFHKGGPTYRYRLEIRPPRPEIQATVMDDPYALVPGKTVTVKINVSRKNDHNTPMVAVATGLPPGVTATSADVPRGGGEVSLTLSATKDAKPASQPTRILLLSTEVAHPELLPATIDLHKDADKPAGQSYIDRSPEVWLTLSPPADATPPKKDRTTASGHHSLSAMPTSPPQMLASRGIAPGEVGTPNGTATQLRRKPTFTTFALPFGC